jgi:NTP pyrophosphatase (non-canonical NTP hydrolase)
MTSCIEMEARTMPPSDLRCLADQVRAFALEREWEPFHSPKNLASALSVEAAELLEHFQWMTEAESRALAPEQREEVALEAADVLLYLVQLADKLGIDLFDAAQRKLAINARRYPVETARGSSRKAGRHDPD